MPKINATFETRRDAELAIEHLVQEYGIDRGDIDVATEGDQNSTGAEANSPDNDTDLEDGTDEQAAVSGRIELSVTIESEETAESVQDVLEEYGGDDLRIEG